MATLRISVFGQWNSGSWLYDNMLCRSRYVMIHWWIWWILKSPMGLQNYSNTATSLIQQTIGLRLEKPTFKKGSCSPNLAKCRQVVLKLHWWSMVSLLPACGFREPSGIDIQARAKASAFLRIWWYQETVWPTWYLQQPLKQGWWYGDWHLRVSWQKQMTGVLLKKHSRKTLSARDLPWGSNSISQWNGWTLAPLNTVIKNLDSHSTLHQPFITPRWHTKHYVITTVTSTQSQSGLAAATPGLVALQEARGTEVVGALPVWKSPWETSQNGVVYHGFAKLGRNGYKWYHLIAPSRSCYDAFYSNRVTDWNFVLFIVRETSHIHWLVLWVVYRGAGTTPLSLVIHTHCTSSWQIHGSPRETLSFAGWTWVWNKHFSPRVSPKLSRFKDLWSKIGVYSSSFEKI